MNANWRTSSLASFDEPPGERIVAIDMVLRENQQGQCYLIG